MKACETLNCAAESQASSTKKPGFRKFKSVVAAVLLGTTMAAVGVLSSAEPAQAGGRYYRASYGHSRAYYGGRRYYSPRSYRPCYRGYRY
ncbi:hypothetical protein C7B61_11715 [filamentous cyanobacterium CCP1]|nr:hypothetical protein C7B76_08425 [filamentous cyanobacterium CCP2]PSB64925.1 hypothetical protein C7B61_11715 [filamentous cyanobacterium CCP1]